MDIKVLLRRFSEYPEVFAVRTFNDKVEVVVSTRMAWRILEALRIYSMVEEAMHEFGKEVREMIDEDS